MRFFSNLNDSLILDENCTFLRIQIVELVEVDSHITMLRNGLKKMQNTGMASSPINAELPAINESVCYINDHALNI
jgi:hypothetical protein